MRLIEICVLTAQKLFQYKANYNNNNNINKKKTIHIIYSFHYLQAKHACGNMYNKYRYVHNSSTYIYH